MIGNQHPLTIFYLFWHRSLHRHSFLDFVDWDPFDDDPFEVDFQNHDLYFPRIPRELGVRHVTAAHPLVKRNYHKMFQLSMDVKGFDPNELSLQLEGRELLIKGFQSCGGKRDKPCFQKRFCWRRKLPADVDLSSVKATLTKPNTLEIEATKIRHYEGQNIQIDVRENSDIDQSLPVRKNHEDENQNTEYMHEHNVNQESSLKGDEEATVEIVPDENLNPDYSD